MKKNMLLLIAFIAITSISGETQEECTKKVMDAGSLEVKACDPKKGDERKVCRDAAREKLSAGKKACFEEGKKNK